MSVSLTVETYDWSLEKSCLNSAYAWACETYATFWTCGMDVSVCCSCDCWAGVTAPRQAGLALSAVHRYTEISTLLCQYVRVLSTCLTNSSPVPSKDKLIAITTMSATVMVRLRRSPIQISWNTKFERILALSHPSVVRCGLARHAVSRR